jgi:trk system potassium uptake protein TrkH
MALARASDRLGFPSTRARWSLRRLRPTTLVVLSFAAVIAVGTLLLSLPSATRTGTRLPLVDAFFTATSATCVTGLTVVDTGATFSLFGQLVILLCIQVGGLGLMTLTTVFAVFMGQRLGILDRAAVQESFQALPSSPVAPLLRHIVLGTLAIEAAGAAVLAAYWMVTARFDSPATAAYQALFHAVSAFCNAGFALFSTNLAEFSHDPVVMLVIATLVLAGGLGFLVGHDLRQFARTWFARRRLMARGDAGRPPRLTVHTRLVLVVTASLLGIGTLSYYLLERNGALAGMPAGVAWLNALFMSVTPRTAGFNTVDYAALGGGTLLCTMVLMMIGASPGSTGGGVKTSTFGVLLAYALWRLRGFVRLHLFGRTIPQETIDRAGAVVMAAIALVVGAASVLMVTESRGLGLEEEQRLFLPVLFETISAFGTVGLSMGQTALLTPAGKMTIAAVMFLGRVGPLTLALAIASRRRRAQVRFAEEPLMIG